MPVGKVTQVSQTKPWYGGLSNAYGEAALKETGPGLYAQYTYGLAGERFFREIKDNAKILGSRCQKCNLTYLPPRIYCERCFEEIKEWREIENKGEIYTYTIARVALDGSPLEEPIILALVKFDDVYGGLVQQLDEVSIDKVKIGMPVKVAFKEKKKRKGSILDISFKPAKG